MKPYILGKIRKNTINLLSAAAIVTATSRFKMSAIFACSNMKVKDNISAILLFNNKGGHYIPVLSFLIRAMPHETQSYRCMQTAKAHIRLRGCAV